MSYNDGYYYGWYQYIPTHGIEDLDLTFEFMATGNLVSFQERFPNLKKLTLEIHSQPDEPRRGMLSKILPYVPRLKSLGLVMIGGDDSYRLLSDVTQLSELEELSLDLLKFDFHFPEFFLNQLPTCCPKLRVLRLSSCINVNDKSIQTLLSLPQLERFECTLQNHFPLIELPEMKHLTELCLNMNTNQDLTGFFEALKKMNRLERLFLNLNINFREADRLHLVCGIIVVATSQEKDVVLSHRNIDEENTKLTITRTSNQKGAEIFEKDSQILQIALNYSDEEPLVEGVKKFVRKELRQYHVFVLKNKDYWKNQFL